MVYIFCNVMMILRILHECSCFIELLNKLEKRDQLRGLPSILSLFPDKFNKFNNTGVRMLSYDNKITLKSLSAVKRYNFVIMYETLL